MSGRRNVNFHYKFPDGTLGCSAFCCVRFTDDISKVKCTVCRKAYKDNLIKRRCTFCGTEVEIPKGSERTMHKTCARKMEKIAKDTGRFTDISFVTIS